MGICKKKLSWSISKYTVAALVSVDSAVILNCSNNLRTPGSGLALGFQPPSQCKHLSVNTPPRGVIKSLL